MVFKPGFFLAAATLPVARAAFYTSADQVPTLEPDFIVVGAGAGGSVAANRLTENTGKTVLVIEAGGSNRDLNIQVPDYCKNLGAAGQSGKYDWNYTSIPQESLDNREIAVARGHVLGGSTSVNCMIMTRGPSDDYDKIAEIVQDDSWTWDNLEVFMKRYEQFGPPVDNRDYSDEYVPTVHGYKGPLNVVPRNYIHELDPYVEASGNEIGGDLTYNQDMNTGDVLGFGWVQFAIDNGTRGDAGTEFLGNEFENRDGLSVLLGNRVTRLYSTGNNTFKTVEFTPDNGQTWINATAKTAIVLSAGSVNTPNLLMHSGIGERSMLEAAGIPVVHELPSVGKNWTEQPSTRLEFMVNSTDTEDTLVRNTTYARDAEAQWNATKDGVLSMGPLLGIGWLRNPEDAVVGDPSSGPGTPHYELYIWYGLPFETEEPAEGNYLTIGNTVLTQHSNGSVSVNSSDPFADPVIDLQMLVTDWEMYTMRESLKMIQTWAAADAWDGKILQALQNFTTDDDYDSWGRATSRMANHPSGGAGMSPKGADWGVVDPDTSVKGLTDLWVVDSSIFPLTPAAHTMAPTYIIAERGVQFVKDAYNL